LKDYPVLLEAREEAFCLVAKDPTLSDPAHALLAKRLREAFPEGMGLVTVS
jgi:hypothetical protein